jgi:hypothetical protein
MLDNNRHAACDVGLLFVFDGSLSTTTNVSSRTAHQDRISLSHTHSLSSLFLPEPSPMYSNSKHIHFLGLLSNCLGAWLLFSSLSYTSLFLRPTCQSRKGMRQIPPKHRRMSTYHTTQHHISEGLSTVRCHIPKHYITLHKLRCRYVRFLISRAATPHCHCARTVPVADLAARLFC